MIPFSAYKNNGLRRIKFFVKLLNFRVQLLQQRLFENMRYNYDVIFNAM